MRSLRLRRKRHNRRLLLIGVVICTVTAIMVISGAQAAVGTGVASNGLFQLDGNTLPGTCANPFPGTNAGQGDDWAALYNHVSELAPCGSDGFSFVADGVGSADNTYWSGGGSKDAYDPALGPWQWKPNDVSPDKNDIVNAFAAIYHADPTGANTPFLYFGSDRYNTNGDAQMGFQFLQSAVCLAGPVSGVTPGGDAACAATTPNQAANAGKFVDPTTGDLIHHENGDLLILVNFNKGGTLGLAGVFAWAGADGAGAGAYSVVLSSGTSSSNPPADCATVAATANFCASASTTSLAGEPVWPYTAKGTTGQATYAPSSFIEGGVNLDSVAGADECFPTFIAETRSSAGPSSGLSLQAQLKDLAFGRFQLCAPSTSLEKTADPTTIRSGGSVTYTYRETNDGRDPLTQVSVTDNKCTTLNRGTDDPGNNDTTLSPGETWVYTCTTTITTTASSVTNTATATGFDAALNKTVTYCADPTAPPTGTFCDQDERAQATVTVIHPATSLTQNASISVTFTYTEDNTGDDPLSAPTVTDTNCSPVTYSSGDTNTDNKLDPDETWIFTCTKAATTSGTNVDYTAAATGSGTDSLGGAVGGASDPKENESVDVKVTHHHHS